MLLMQELVDKRHLMLEEYRRYKDSAIQLYNQQRELRLQLRGGEKHCPVLHFSPDSFSIILILY